MSHDDTHIPLKPYFRLWFSISGDGSVHNRLCIIDKYHIMLICVIMKIKLVIIALLFNCYQTYSYYSLKLTFQYACRPSSTWRGIVCSIYFHMKFPWQTKGWLASPSTCTSRTGARTTVETTFSCTNMPLFFLPLQNVPVYTVSIVLVLKHDWLIDWCLTIMAAMFQSIGLKLKFKDIFKFYTLMDT